MEYGMQYNRHETEKVQDNSRSLFSYACDRLSLYTSLSLLLSCSCAVHYGQYFHTRMEKTSVNGTLHSALFLRFAHTPAFLKPSKKLSDADEHHLPTSYFPEYSRGKPSLSHFVGSVAHRPDYKESVGGGNC